MTDEEMNIAIAKLCGWKWTSQEVWRTGKEHFLLGQMGEQSKRFIDYLPDYCNDLNAINREEQIFLERATLEQISSWLDNLYRAHGLNPYDWRNAHGSGKTDPTPPAEMAKVAASTARQRAEAFIATLAK